MMANPSRFSSEAPAALRSVRRNVSLFSRTASPRTVDVTVRGDAVLENNETFLLTLRNAAGASLLKRDGFAIIEEDDYAADLSLAPVFANPFSGIEDSISVANNGPSAATDIVVK